MDAKFLMAVMNMGRPVAMNSSSRSVVATARKVSNEMEAKMREMDERGVSMKAIGRALGVNETTVRRRLRGRN